MTPTATQLAEMLEEHLVYEVRMLFVTHDILVQTQQIHPVLLNVFVESFCIHARNLFEFLTKKDGGGKNYAFAKAYLPSFKAFEDPAVNAMKDTIYQKISAQIAHLSFNRVRSSSDKVRTTHEVPEARRLLVPEMRAFVNGLPLGHRQHWDAGAAKCGLSRWGF